MGFPRSSIFFLVSVAFSSVDNYICREGKLAEGRTASFNLVGADNCFVFLVMDIINFNETSGLTIYCIYSSTFPTCLFHHQYRLKSFVLIVLR